MTPLETRQALKAAGFSPIPCKGKQPLIDGWQTKLDVSPEEMAAWPGSNTGMLCAYTPAFDIDILDPQAATEAEREVKDWFDGRGIIPVRIGLAPKRALLFRTGEPFPKVARHFKAPNGATHKIEVLCRGQQIVVDGVHPDTHRPYAWYGGQPGEDVTYSDPVEVTEQEVHELLEYVAQVLSEKFNWEAAQPLGGNGQVPAGESSDWGAPVDVDARLAAVHPGDKGGAGVHDTGLRCTAALLRSGHSVDAAVLTVLEQWQRSPDTAGWDWEDEERKLRRQCFDLITKHPDLSYLLPDDLRGKFDSAVQGGKRPKIIYSKHIGWHVRGFEYCKDPSLPPDEAVATAIDDPRKYRFRLVSFADLKPGPEPLYLVDELVPIAGLVDVWGKAKCYKSFWCLDLMLHVAMGWEYRDRYVRQGAVVYCAFEGAHGYKKRVEALRRHYIIEPAADIPLYVMPGQANLITEHRVLISDIAAQLGATNPVAVVLDTLNKSLVGSENKDIDMGNYVRAAEAIRDRFECVVIIIHHCGYDDTRPRGHSSLPGAVDAQLAVVRAEDIVTVTVEMMRDGPEDTQVVNAVEVVEVGQDQNGKVLTSLVVIPSEADPTRQYQNLPRGLGVFMAAARATLAKQGQPLQPEAGVLPVRAVGQWFVRDRFYATYAEPEEDEKKRQSKLRQAFNRALSEAQGRGMIRVLRADGETMIWLPERGELA